MTRHLVAAATAFLVATASASAQTPPAKSGKMDHSKMEQETHAMSPWKELDAFHMLVMATWHPAAKSSDMAPTRAKASELLASAKTLAASTAPKGCDSPKLKEATAGMPAQAQGVADLVSKKADDATLKAALKALHDKFEVIESGCVKPAGMKH